MHIWGIGTVAGPKWAISSNARGKLIIPVPVLIVSPVQVLIYGTGSTNHSTTRGISPKVRNKYAAQLGAVGN